MAPSTRSFRRPSLRRWHWSVAGLALGGATLLTVGNPAAWAGEQHTTHPAAESPIGIVDATPKEQAAILSLEQVRQTVKLDGYNFYVGTIRGNPVVDVAGGEGDEAAELATSILDAVFHPRATVFSGTAGAQNSKINVGDVVLSGFVVDKDAIHYQTGGYQTTYSSLELHNSGQSDIAGAIVDSYGSRYPTPADASTYPSTSHPTDTNWVFLDSLAGDQQLVTTAAGDGSALGTTTKADATGVASASGTVTNKIVVGTIGEAPVWTEPLSWIEAQNMLYETDAEENEGTGFSYANAQLGIPWMLVRGISDTPWYPNAYDSELAAQRAAQVTAYMVEHLPATIKRAPARLSSLSPIANATVAGYLIAGQAYFDVGPVTKVTYTDPSGATQTLEGSALAALEQEYAPGSGDLG